MTRSDEMEILLVVFFIEILFIIIVDAVNPGCECYVFTGTYGKEYGTFSSPDYPQPYRDNISCLLYTFAANASQIVEITFKDFDVHRTHIECSPGDFLKLYLHLERPEVNEYSQSSRVLCGSYAEIPHLHYSSGPAAVMEFHSDHNPARSTGFLGRFRFIDKRMFQTDGQKIAGTTCDHQFTSSNYSRTSGRFYSPRYPSSYPKTTKCNYRFRGRLKERIRIVFEEVALQSGDVSCLNRADVIKVLDGRDDGRQPVIAFLCNELSGVEVLSTGPHLHVLFVANSQSPGQGFKATYQFQPAGDAAADSREFESGANNLEGISLHHRYSTDLGPAVSATTSSCDVVVSSDSWKNGTVSSPLFPKPYPPSSYCQYDFQGRGNERVQIVFTHFNLYHAGDINDQCESTDSLVAFVLIGGRKEKLESFCGTNLPKPVMSNGARLLLEFRGIYSSRYSTGFKASYSFLTNLGVRSGQQLSEYPCAFAFESNVSLSGNFTSPNYPGHYPRDTECHYFFHGGTTHTVLLHFDYFDVEGVPPCEAVSASDYVEFSNYMGRDRRYQRHCGQQHAFDVRSDRHFFRVTFRSDDRLDGTGFHASYRFLDKDALLATTPPARQRKLHASTRHYNFNGYHQCKMLKNMP